MSGQPFYITTAIAYPNGVPHIGHAYEAIATDAIARFRRLEGYDVFFLTGTDEHGSKMLQTAAKENLTPRQLVERNVPRFQAMVKMLNCSNDDFIRTTEPRHYRASEAIWERMQANGDIYLDKYSGWYSVRDEAYYDESETRLDDNGQRLGGADIVVVRAVELLHHGLETRHIARDQFARRNLLLGRRLQHLDAVLVGAGEEEHVAAVEPHEAGDGIGRNQLVGVADMRRAVRVGDRGGDVIGLAGQFLFVGHEGRYQPRVASASKLNTPKTSGFRSKL